MELAVERHRLKVQGFCLDAATVKQIGVWLRFTPALCTTLIAIGTVLASVPTLLVVAATGALGALFPRHPFDLIYNHGIRFLTGTPKLPINRAPRRFACGVGAVWLTGTATAFASGQAVLGYVLGGTMVAMGLLQTLTVICVPSLIYRWLFARPAPGSHEDARARRGDSPTLPTATA